jgi:hypothetical protein
MNKDKEFFKRMVASQKFPYLLARKVFMWDIANLDWKQALDFLKRRDKRYSEKIDTEQEITTVGPDLSEKTPKEIMEYIKSILKSK